MRRLTWLGIAGVVAMLPRPAHAFDGAAILVPSGLIVLAAIAAVAIIVARYRGRVKALEAERARLAAALAERDALVHAAPAALYCWRAGAKGVRLAAGSLGALPGSERFDTLAATLVPDDRAALAEALARLEHEGQGFALPVRVAAESPQEARSLDLIGLRLGQYADGPVDLVWTSDAGARDERDRMRRLIDTVPRPLWRRRGSDLALIDCNRAYAAAVDATVEAVLAEGRELGAGVIAQGGRGLALRARSTGAAQTESHHVVIGGSRRLFAFTEAPLSPGGDIIGWTHDLTDLESKEAELQRHVAAHAEVLENIAVAIAIYGADTRLAFFNIAFARLWNLEEEWLASKPNLDEVLERLRERRRLPEHADFRAFKQQQRAMFTSLIDPHEDLLHLPDERTLRLVVSPHPFGGLIYAYEDVTDRLALERSYNTLIEVQRETLDNLYEAIAVFGSDGRLKLWNPVYAQIWRVSPDDLAGEPHVAEVVEKTRALLDDGGAWPETKRRVIARITAHEATTTRLERRDGSILQAAIVPLPDGNILLSYLDVTDRTRVEEALRERNEALETAGRLKSEFIANVSYELRTPLNAIIGFAEILTNQYFGELNPRQLEYSRGILESSNRLLSLINDILDLATVEAGYMQLEPHEVDIHALMSSVMTFTRERARNQGLRLQFDVPPKIGAIVADERRLKQALFNLVSNALKFTPAGGTVTLAARRERDRVALVVADTGVGVAREDQVRIFEKFERGNPHARQSGPGLGLSLVKSFIELHGGKVELESHPGRGTTITCYLYDRADALMLRPAGE
ncbi:MAG TPA: ATP-binding protein [Stellaceae bacterium]|nr:ATP-binding protein [Stellaceae bacterium]